MDSQNVFLTKSFWSPVASFIVTKAALTIQDWVVLSVEEQTAIAGGVTMIVIAVVRAVTSRPAHFVKPKNEDTE